MAGHTLVPHQDYLAELGLTVIRMGALQVPQNFLVVGHATARERRIERLSMGHQAAGHPLTRHKIEDDADPLMGT